MAWFENNTSRIYYEEQGSGTPVLLLPGWGGNISDLSAVTEALSPHYRVIAADLPGSGRSEPQPRTYTASYLEDDAHSFVALLEHLTTGPAHLIGFSDGGETSLLMAILAPGLARSVVTWGSVGMINDPGGHMRDAMYNMVDRPIPPMQTFSRFLTETYGTDNARSMTQSFANALTDIIEQHGGDISFSRASTITCPALLITGEHDPFVPPTLLSQLAEVIPNSEMLEVKHAGHAVQASHAEWLTQTILGWLAKH